MLLPRWLDETGLLRPFISTQDNSLCEVEGAELGVDGNREDCSCQRDVFGFET